jgi:hypothetical protein
MRESTLYTKIKLTEILSLPLLPQGLNLLGWLLKSNSQVVDSNRKKAFSKSMINKRCSQLGESL